MLYEFPFTISKNTFKDSPYEENVKLEGGLITYMEIEFPDGCKGYAGVKVRHGNFQVTPKNPEAWHVSDDYVIPIRLYYEFFEPPYILTLVGYNEDDSYDHTPRIRVTIIPREVVAEYMIPTRPYVEPEYVEVPGGL